MVLRRTTKGILRASAIASLLLVAACGEPPAPTKDAPYADKIHYQAAYGR